MIALKCVVLILVLGQCLGWPLNIENLPTTEELLQMPGFYDGRIVGGEEADIEDYPHQVSFIVNNSFFCGGFILSIFWIGTAAHCAQDVDPSTVALRAGSSWRKNGTLIPIAEVYAHPEYDDTQLDKDVAVMKTVDRIPLNGETIMAIPLPPEGRSMVEGTDIMVSGWGRTHQASSIPDRLMAVQIPVVNDTQCKMAYESTFTENQFCAGNFLLGGKSACQGDSGGAAIQDGMAVGIVSYGRLCGQPLAPSVFANIAAPTIRQFIKKITGL